MDNYVMNTTIEATFDGNVFRPSKPLALAANTMVRLTVEPIVKPRPASLTLQELVALVTDENIHPEVNTGPAIGGEAW